MKVEDVVQGANNSSFDKTGEHFTPLQEAILTGVWQSQKYPQIAKEFNCSESHVKKEAGKLWEKLREELGEDLLSWEKPREITALEAVNLSTRTLNLKGLGKKSAEIFREKKLADEEKWSDLIDLYQGQPSWLNIIAATILELFNGSVSLFLAHGTDLFLGDLEPL